MLRQETGCLSLRQVGAVKLKGVHFLIKDMAEPHKKRMLSLYVKLTAGRVTVLLDRQMFSVTKGEKHLGSSGGE